MHGAGGWQKSNMHVPEDAGGHAAVPPDSCEPGSRSSLVPKERRQQPAAAAALVAAEESPKQRRTLGARQAGDAAAALAAAGARARAVGAWDAGEVKPAALAAVLWRRRGRAGAKAHTQGVRHGQFGSYTRG
jgi:hypothetical protein